MLDEQLASLHNRPNLCPRYMPSELTPPGDIKIGQISEEPANTLSVTRAFSGSLKVAARLWPF